MTRQELIKAISELSDTDTSAVIRAAQDIKAALAAGTLSVGDTVRFNAKTRGIKTGELTKINRKKAKVMVGMVTWTVPLAMLDKVA